MRRAVGVGALLALSACATSDKMGDRVNPETPLWYTHRDFYRKSRHYLADFRLKEGRLPTSEEFRRFAQEII